MISGSYRSHFQWVISLKQQNVFAEPGMIEQIIDFAYKKKEGQLEIHRPDGIVIQQKTEFIMQQENTWLGRGMFSEKKKSV